MFGGLWSDESQDEFDEVEDLNYKYHQAELARLHYEKLASIDVIFLFKLLCVLLVLVEQFEMIAKEAEREKQHPHSH